MERGQAELKPIGDLMKQLKRSPQGSPERTPKREPEDHLGSPSFLCDICDDERMIEVRFSVVVDGQEWLRRTVEAFVLAKDRLEEVRSTGDVKLIEQREAHVAQLERQLEHSFPSWKSAAVPCTCANRARVSRLLKSASVPDGMNFDTWETRPGTELAYDGARAFIESDAQGVLVIHGPYGAGKTHLLGSIIDTLARGGTSARYRYVSMLRQELIGSLGRGTEMSPTDELITSYATRGVLGLDDLGAGAEKPRPFIVEAIETIVNMRYESRVGLIVTTNLTPEEMAANWGGRIADRLFDVHSGRAKQVFITAGSYRR